MRQQLTRITCDQCGIVETFETTMSCHNGPIVATLDPYSILERRGWRIIRNGLRSIDTCDKCVAVEREG